MPNFPVDSHIFKCSNYTEVCNSEAEDMQGLSCMLVPVFFPPQFKIIQIVVTYGDGCLFYFISNCFY